MVYGPRLLFAGVDLNLQDGNRYAIVGANGAGKTTFLQLITGEQEYSSGEIIITKNSRVGWLKQDHYKYEDELILNVVLRGRPVLWNALERKYALLKEKTLTPEMGYELSDLEEIIAANGGYEADSEVQKLLIGLGIKEAYHFEPLRVLSGGYKLRVLLAQILFNNPTVLLLDEPTNYLDIASISWLEKYLKNEFTGLLLFISHDQDFLNTLATHVLDIDYGEITEYVGNYDQFMARKQMILEQKMNERDFQERKIARLQVFIDKFRASASRAKQSASREKMIGRIELPEIKQSSRRSPYFHFDQTRPSGKQVVTLKGITKKFQERTVLNHIGFTVARGEKIAIIGRNGIGKSTLLKILVKSLTPDKGTFEWGFETAISYMDQDQHASLDENMTLFEWLMQCSNEKDDTIRKTLGHMLFSKDDVHKRIKDLSGGEICRLLFARMMLEKRNVLILDEPTNHLDIEAKNALAKALISYPGTMLCVSHDRHFLSTIANRVIALTEKGIQDFHGSYQEFVNHYGIDYLNQ